MWEFEVNPKGNEEVGVKYTKNLQISRGTYF
jgi:hypothetical protein